MDKLMFLGDSLMMCLAISLLISAVILIVNVVKSQELKDRIYTRELKTEIQSITYLRLNRGVTVPEEFIYGHKNTGKSPCDLVELEIDSCYLTPSSNVLMEEGNW